MLSAFLVGSFTMVLSGCKPDETIRNEKVVNIRVYKGGYRLGLHLRAERKI